MFELKVLSKNAIPAALGKAERYRLLNEPAEAESICLDVLSIEPENQAALITLVLAVTDQFADDLPRSYRHAKDLLPRIASEYDRLYYAGIISERTAKVLAARAEKMQRHRVPVEVLDDAAVRRLEPAISTEARGALFFPDEASLDPRPLARERRVAIERGAAERVERPRLDRLDAGREDPSRRAGGLRAGDAALEDEDVLAGAREPPRDGAPLDSSSDHHHVVPHGTRA